MEKIFLQGSCDYGSFIDNTRLIFVRDIRSWTNTKKMKEFIQDVRNSRINNPANEKKK